MKICVIGDIHGSAQWRDIVEVERDEVQKFVFLGDYVDDKNLRVTFTQQRDNLLSIMRFAEEFGAVDLLTGNHDLQYTGGTRCNTYFRGLEQYVRDIYHSGVLDGTFKICAKYDNYLFSHAGVSAAWMAYRGISEVENLNDIFKEMPRMADLVEVDGSKSEDNIFQSPLWIRAKNGLYRSPIYGIHQVVGHTRKDKIEITYMQGCKFIFTDTGLKEYLIVDTDKESDLIKLTPNNND